MAGYTSYIADLGQTVDIEKITCLLGTCDIRKHLNSIVWVYDEFHITIFSDGELRIEFPPEEDAARQLLKVAQYLKGIFGHQGIAADIEKVLLNAEVIEGTISAGVITHLNLKTARPTLGPTCHVNLYRMMVHLGLYEQMGENAKNVLYKMGSRVGGRYVGSVIADLSTPELAFEELSRIFKENGIGILSVSEASGDEIARIHLEESVTASGFPNIGKKVCHFEAGFIAGYYTKFFGKEVQVKEEECWANGDDDCEFAVFLWG